MKPATFYPFMAGLTIGLALTASALLGQTPAAAVAVSHRHTQARTDAQPALKDDLASQKPDTGNAPALPDLGEVIGAHLQASVPTMTLHVAPFHCPPCNSTKQAAAQVQAVRIETVVGGADIYPTLRYAGHEWHGALTASQIDAIAREYKPAAIPQAMSVGSIAIYEQVNQFLSLVKQGKDGPEIVSGGARILLPQKSTVEETFTPDTYTRTYTGGSPTFVYGILRAPVQSLTLNRDKLRLSVGGWPVELAVTK